MIRKKVLSIGSNSATLLVQDTEAGGALRVLRRMNVAEWAAEEVSSAVRMYEELQKRRLRGFVPIHTVLVQSSFLSVVASYASEGDVTTLIEEEEYNALEEANILRWLCACALAIRQLHLHHLFFPGLTGDRLFVDHHTGGSANLLLGVPLPLPVYYAQLQERKKNGVHVALDYPPEVLAAIATHPVNSGEGAKNNTRSGSGYHPTLSDVWCLGRLGVVLLTAKGTNMARRSGTTRQLLSRMMADVPTTRPSMESVVQSLVALAGNVTLGQPPWPLQPATAPSTASAQVAPVGSTLGVPCRPLQVAASGSTGGGATTVGQSTAAENSSTGGGASKAQHPTKASSHGYGSSQPPSSTMSSTPSDAPSTRLHHSQRHPVGSPATVEHPSQPPPMSACTPHADYPGRLVHATEDNWHRRAGEKFEMLQRMNASPPKQHAFIRGGETPQGTLRGEHGHHRLRGSTSNLLNTKSPSPRRNSRGGFIDHNTRVLDEIFAEQGEMLRKAGIWHPSPQRRVDDAQPSQRENVRQLRLETAARQQEMRKHFTEWQRQNNQRLTDADNVEVIDQDGIVIVAPRPAPAHELLPVTTAAPAAENKEINTDVEPMKRRSQFMEDAQNEASRRQAPLPASPPPQSSTSRLSTPRTKTPTDGRTRAATANAYPTRRNGNRPRSSHTPLSTQEVHSARGAGFSGLPPPPNSVQPCHLRSNDSSGPITNTSNDSDEDPAHNTNGDNRSMCKSATDAGTFSTVAWTIDGIRSTLRTLLRNRNLYSETMQEVALFIGQPEEARLEERANAIFMKRLRKLFHDDELFFGVVPLCAQLAALEGLDHTLRDSASGLSSRQRH
ncbi:hypothetical protein, conserved [Leishmania tarentolae]|uniref:Protein kinase domain-containing protein n=1 Tax=Leishmania tarentolae TaxID=5689 RepID=A0A640KRJ6_LEITA|nr:hypothetical protein, conserved [Leishmania tarentolae]